MTGSNVAAIVIPCVMLPVLAIWLFAVYHAANHPGIKRPEAVRQRLAAMSYQVEPGAVPQQGGPPAEPSGPSAEPREEVPAGAERRSAG
jgi:hypothetical protein